MRTRRLARVGVATLILAAMPTVCGSGDMPAIAAAIANPTTSTIRTATATRAATGAVDAAGAQPSALAKMICAEEAQADLSSNLGVRVTVPVLPSWKDHLYSCEYRSGGGSFTLSVKELSDAAAATLYFRQWATKLGKVPPPLRIGDEAFAAKNGSVVVRKDRKVLFVDVTKLPAAFGRPPLDRLTAAETIAITIMECWTGG